MESTTACAVNASLACSLFTRRAEAKIRLILDCRRANARFWAPPGTELLSSEGFSNIEFDDTGCGKTNLEQLRLHLGVGDVADRFHRMGSLRTFFLLAVPPGRQSGRPRSRGQHVKPEQKVWPMANSLPLEWSWSLHFAQKANLRRIGSVGLLSKSVLLTDRGRPAILKPGSKGVTSHYVYVDNFGTQSLEEQAAKECLDAATAAFEEKHLTVHEMGIQCEEASALGIVLDGRRLETRALRRRRMSECWSRFVL